MKLNVIGQPLLEAAAQTFVGAIASYGFDKIRNGFYKDNIFEGAFDFWQRGIHHNSVVIWQAESEFLTRKIQNQNNSHKY